MIKRLWLRLCAWWVRPYDGQPDTRDWLAGEGLAERRRP